MVVVQAKRARKRVRVLIVFSYLFSYPTLSCPPYRDIDVNVALGVCRTIRLPAGADYLTHYHDSGSNAFDTIASVPWFLFGLASVAYEYVSSSVDSLTATFRARRGYRDLPIDEDAQILRFEDEE